MIFKNDEEAIAVIKASQQVPPWVTEARNYAIELAALVDGKNFHAELIQEIEKLESKAKGDVRRKYARDIQDFFDRLFLPIENVFSSTGSVKNYRNGQKQLPDFIVKALLKIVSNIRDGKSLERYIQDVYMNLFQTDPAGVLWVRYEQLNGVVQKVYPTYWSISNIRNYVPNGQIVEWIVFEPVKTKEGKFLWTIIDDAMQRVYLQDGDTFVLQSEGTFKHPFGTVPVIINSNIINKEGKRLSPIHKIIAIAKEFARDQSVKTVYKFQQGFPKHWRRSMICRTCYGSGKNGKDDCTACNGKGELGKTDVADVAVLPMPIEGEPVVSGKDIMGFNSPDIETWRQFTEELEFLEDAAYFTHWGIRPVRDDANVKTATEVHIDLQPQINRLNKYADAAEWVEWKITEWIANALDQAKDKEQAISLIIYGRRYILEGIDTIQKKYEDAKKAGENIVVLDSIFDELLTVKYKNDPEFMALELKKARLEPFLHLSFTEIKNFFGPEETARKAYFQKWWKGLPDTDLKKEITALDSLFETAFNVYLPKLKLPITQKPAPTNE